MTHLEIKKVIHFYRHISFERCACNRNEMGRENEKDILEKRRLRYGAEII